MKVLFTAGTWDKNGGKTSELMNKMYELLNNQTDFDITFFNGGLYDELNDIVMTAKDYDIIFWMANVPYELEPIKFVKSVNPIALVIGSKKNINRQYSFVDILNKTLLQRNNLSILFSKNDKDDKYEMNLFDPLGTSWYEGYSMDDMVDVMVKRIRFVLTTRRERTFKVEGTKDIPNHEDFFKYVRDVAEIFHKTIEHADGVTRFLGNASFRGDDVIYVSKRDVNKALIDKNNFVAAYLGEDDKVYYYGEYKPSKDTVVQTRLYKMFPNINYIIHSHCYASGAEFTNIPVPCGALDEIDEVLDVVKNKYNNDFSLNYYKFNLNGHGCLIFGSSIDDLKKTEYITRHLPEKI